MVAAYGESEDCLTLNIWTPATSADESLPVLVWTHDDGTAPGDAMYDGAGMASKGIIFVSYNFRSGALGFFADKALNETWAETLSPTGSPTGNWGLLDQWHAVKWVYANIALFGGNPDHISIAGTGTGAAAVYHMVNSEQLSDFNISIVNAISHSGLRYPSDPLLQQEASAGAYYNLTYAETLATNMLQSLNASSTAEARALSYQDILDTTASIDFRPVLDYFLIPDLYSETLLNGSAYKVPFMTGHNADELPSATAVSTYQTWVEEEYGSEFSEEFLALYPINETSALTRDHARISSWLFMNAFSKSSEQETYTYYWDYPNGAATKHSEVSYALGNLWAQTGANYTQVSYCVSSILNSYWVNFITSGDPNNSTQTSGATLNETSLPATWEPNSATAQQTFQVGTGWDVISIAGTPEKLALMEKYFAAQTSA